MTNVSITDIVTNVTIEGDEVNVTVGQGQSGVGVPAGGTTGQVLAKTSATDYATAWTSPTAPTSATYIDFDTATAYADAIARLRWDSAYSTLSLGLDADVQLKIGQGLYKLARNNSGGPIAKGEVVYISGAHGGTQLAVALASNTSEVTSAETVGVAAEAIANNASGMVQTFGYLEGFTTNGYAGAEGTPLYLGATAGTMQSNLPTQPAHGVRVGFLVKKAGGGAGSIFVNVQNYQEIEELSDFLKGTYADFDLMSYDLAAGVWRNRTVADALPTNSVALNKLAQIATTRLLGNSSGATGSPAAIGVNAPLGFNGVNGNLEIAAPGAAGQVFFHSSGSIGASAFFVWNNATSTLTLSNALAESVAFSPSGITANGPFTIADTGGGNGTGITLDDSAESVAFANYTFIDMGSATVEVGAVQLPSGEQIQNPVNGRVDILPLPSGANEVGITFDMTSVSNAVQIGTKRTSNGVLNDGRVQMNVPIQTQNNVWQIFGGYQWSGVQHVFGSSLPQQLCIGVSRYSLGGNDNGNHVLALMNYGHVGNANRRASTLYADPSFLVYSADIAQANDFARLTHDQTDGLLESGNGKLRLKGASVVRIEGSGGGFDIDPTPNSNGSVMTLNNGVVSFQTPSGGGGGISEEDAVALAVAL